MKKNRYLQTIKNFIFPIILLVVLFVLYSLIMPSKKPNKFNFETSINNDKKSLYEKRQIVDIKLDTFVKYYFPIVRQKGVQTQKTKSKIKLTIDNSTINRKKFDDLVYRGRSSLDIEKISGLNITTINNDKTYGFETDIKVTDTIKYLSLPAEMIVSIIKNKD